MSISANFDKIKSSIPENVTLVVVTKTQPLDKILEVYNLGYKILGENKVKELVDKHDELPEDIQWHLIGHLQTNKVKYIAPFVHIIQSVDSLKLLCEINKQAAKNNRIINCLLQIYIANEKSKFGLNFSEAELLLKSEEFIAMKNIAIIGLMGMATNTDYNEQISKEFHSLKLFFDKLKQLQTSNMKLEILSMGMSSDYQTAIKEGSTMVRIGSSIFGERD